MKSFSIFSRQRLMKDDQGRPTFQKTTLQYEGDDDLGAMLLFLGKCGNMGNPVKHVFFSHAVYMKETKHQPVSELPIAAAAAAAAAAKEAVVTAAAAAAAAAEEKAAVSKGASPPGPSPRFILLWFILLLLWFISFSKQRER